MERTPTRTGGFRIALIAAVALYGATSRAQAGLIASDSYVTGSDPTMGQYTAYPNAYLSTYNGNPGQSGTLANTGFANGGYNGGIGTSNFVVSSTGLASTADGSTSTDSGSVAWLASTDPTVRSDARNLSSFTEGTTGTYWMSELVSYSPGGTITAGNWILTGFGSTAGVPPVLGTTAGFLTGIYYGFAADPTNAGEADLVLRTRTSTAETATDTVMVANAVAGQTYLVVAEVGVNSNGSQDSVNYWVNPADLNSVGDLNSTSQSQGVLSSTYAYQGSATGSGDFGRLNYAESGWDTAAFFDEARLGTTLASIAPAVAPVPEPASLVLVALGGGLFGLATLRRRRPAR